MKKPLKITLWIIGGIIGAIVLFIVFSFIVVSSFDRKDYKKVDQAIANCTPVELVHPIHSSSAEKIAKAFYVADIDTVFLGYYLGMTKEDFDIQTKKNVKQKLLKKNQDLYTYNLHVTYNNEDTIIRFFVVPSFFDNKLYRIQLKYIYFRAAFEVLSDLPVPYEQAKEVIDAAFKDKFLSEGRIRYDYTDDVEYFKGNTKITIKRSIEQNELKDANLYFDIDFYDCYLSSHTIP